MKIERLSGNKGGMNDIYTVGDMILKGSGKPQESSTCVLSYPESSISKALPESSTSYLKHPAVLCVFLADDVKCCTAGFFCHD